MKKQIVTISGLPGSGKSSAAKGLARELQYEHFSSGDMFRRMAGERGLSIKDINITAEKQKGIDSEVDELLQKLGREKEKMVIDSRTAFHWIPDSFKVFLDLDARTAAERTFAQIQKEGRQSQCGSSVEEVYEDNLKRTASELKRYQDLYCLDIRDKKNYDLVIDTKIYNLQQVIDLIERSYKEWLKSDE